MMRFVFQILLYLTVGGMRFFVRSLVGALFRYAQLQVLFAVYDGSLLLQTHKTLLGDGLRPARDDTYNSLI